MGAIPHTPTIARSWRELVLRQVWAKGGDRHSKSQCMADGCKKPPEVECIWAEGRGRAWHCEKHHDAWVKENEESEGEEGWLPVAIVKQRKVPNGVVGEKYGEYPESKKAGHFGVGVRGTFGLKLTVDSLVAKYRQASAADGKKTGYRDSVGLFIPLPKDLAEQFPSLAPTDNSPPHVTFLYIGSVPPEEDQLLLDTINKVFSAGLPTIKAKLAGLDYFVHPDKERRVAHCPVVFNRGMSELRSRLRSALEDAGIQVGDSFPVYRPHVTLEYLPDTKVEYKGPVPSGTWEFNEIEVWGLPEEHKVGFKTAKDKIPGGLGDEKNPSDFDPKQIAKGIKVELEHTDDEDLAREIAMDHLTEDPAYYDKLETIEKHSRTIPIDKSALRGVTTRLEKQFLQACKVAMRSRADDPIRWREVWVRDSHTIRNVMGQDVTVDVLVTAGKNRSGGPFVDAGGYGFSRQTGRPVVIVKLNGSYTATEYARATETGMLTRGIYNILIHEMTHATDAAIKAQYQTGPASGAYVPDDEAAYYNDPQEVRAYMQQVVDEVLSFGSKRENLEKAMRLFHGPRQRGIEVVLKNTETWPEIEKHLTPANRNKILKAVYQALSEGGYLKGTSKQAFVAEDGWDAAGNHRVVLWPDTQDEEPIIHHTIRPAFEQAGYQTRTVTRTMDDALGVEFLGDRLDPDRLVKAYLDKSGLGKVAGYYNVGDIVLYGKYKNKRGKVVSMGKDEKGNPYIEVEPIPKGKKQNKTLSVLKVWHADPEKRADIKDDPHAPTEFEELMQQEIGPALEDSVTMLVAKYKAKHEDKDGNVHYEYSEKQVQHRDREKAKRIEGLKKAMPKLRTKVKRDLKSSDPKTKLTALAVALMDETYERVGNDESADEGHFGVTGWQAGHVSFGGSTATIKYTGKSGVKHEKSVSTPALVSALREAVADKGKTTKILDYECEDGEACVSPDDVNEYLSEFGITAKDIRGYHANDEMMERLRAIRDKGPTLPRGRKEKDEILKKEFEKALAETAEAVGHEPATLKSNYLVPGVHDSFMHDGTVMESFTKKGTKDQHEKEEESARDLVKKEPRKKPPRDDLRRRRVNDHEDDPDLKKPNATNDPDLSHNYKGRNARGGKKLTPIESDSFMGGTFFRMNVREDRFVHFTPSSRALEIARTKKLLMNPPYKKFGIDAVAAVSLVYGKFVAGTQTTHIKTDEELVGIIFTTNAIPDVGYVEEVLWKRDVPLSKVQIVPANRAISMLGSTPERIDGNDQVYYEGSPHLRRIEDLGNRAAALALRYITVTAKGEPEWASGKTFPHKTEKGETTQVGWKSLTPEEQAKYQKEQDAKSEGEGGEKPKGKDDGEPKGKKDKKEKGKGKGKKEKPKEDPGNPKLTPDNLADDPGSANVLWQAAGGDAEGNPITAKQLADLFEHIKGERITESTAQKILDLREKHGDAPTLSEALKASEKQVVKDILDKADIKSPALKKRLDGMDAEAKRRLTEAMETTEAEYMASPVSSEVASKLAQAHDGKVSDSDLPKDPAELGKYLAERSFTQNVVLNPMMAGGRAVNNDEKSPEELQARAAASFDTFRDLETSARERAADKVLERLKEVEEGSHEAKELNAVLDGVALAAAMSGENVPGRAPPSALFTEVAKSLEQQGEAHTLLAAVDPNSTEGRDALRKGIEGMSDEAMVQTMRGTPILDALADRLKNAIDPEAAASMRQMMTDIATDDIQFVDPMIRDGLEAKGDKGKASDPKVRENIRKEIHSKAFGALQIPDTLDRETQKRLRMGILQWAVGKVKAMLGGTKSMATTQVEQAIEADEPDILNVPAAKPIARPVEGEGQEKKGVQSGAYTPAQLSEGPSPFEEWGMIEPKSPRSIRRNKMPKLLTKKGAEQMMDHAGRLAHVIQHHWEALGIPDQKRAMDLAYRLDVLSDTIERTAAENEVRIAAARAKQAETVGEGTIKDDGGAMLRGGQPEQDNKSSVSNGYDPADIGKLKDPTVQEPDEPYMDAFTQDEFHQLADIQQSGEFSNAKAAFANAARALAQAAAAL